MTRVLRYTIDLAGTDIQLEPDAPLVAAGTTLCLPGTVDVWAVTTEFNYETRTLAFIRTGDTIPDGWEYRLTTPRSPETGLVFHVIERTAADGTDMTNYL